MRVSHVTYAVTTGEVSHLCILGNPEAFLSKYVGFLDLCPGWVFPFPPHPAFCPPSVFFWQQTFTSKGHCQGSVAQRGVGWRRPPPLQQTVLPCAVVVRTQWRGSWLKTAVDSDSRPLTQKPWSLIIGHLDDFWVIWDHLSVQMSWEDMSLFLKSKHEGKWIQRDGKRFWGTNWRAHELCYKIISLSACFCLLLGMLTKTA